MRLLVVGSRGFPETPGKRALYQILTMTWREWRNRVEDGRIKDDSRFVIISGHSTAWDKERHVEVPVGPDWWAEQWAIMHEPVGVERIIISIKDVGGWDTHGKKAGYIRNLALREQNLTHGIFLWDGKSRGTKMMMDLLAEVRPRVPRRIITPDMLDVAYKIGWDER